MSYDEKKHPIRAVGNFEIAYENVTSKTFSIQLPMYGSLTVFTHLSTKCAAVVTRYNIEPHLLNSQFSP